MAQKPTKKYRLTRGTHYVARPGHDPEKDNPEDSHAVAQVGDIVDLTDDQYKAFKDKFVPAEQEAVTLKDDEAANKLAAEAVAAATGQTIDPNKPLEPQVQAPTGAKK